MRLLPGMILVLIVLLATSCAPPVLAPSPTGTPIPAARLPNPASVFCEEQGFSLELRTDATGSQSGVCRFPDGSECDEWSYYRGECGPATQAVGTDPAASATPIASPTAVPPAAAASPSAPANGAATYTSAALGISFDYLPEQNGQSIRVFEEGDKVYVYPTNMEPTAGQWVQVFEKPAGESLVDAISRVIMPGYPAEDCQVTKVSHPLGREPASNYEYAGIVVRRVPGEDMEEMLPRWQTCPQPYTVVGGIGYFQADAQHPDKFLFFSIGQYGIMAGDDQPWQETIRFE